jgi:cobalt-zinc-cadmium resistance protein CzcA
MAKTYAYAIGGGLLAAFTVSPALCALLLPDRLAEVETAITRRLRGFHEHALAFVLANRPLMRGTSAVVLAAALLTIPLLGIEFLPHLEEGNLYIRATMPPSISLEAGQPVVNEARRIIAARPEVQRVVSTHGRPDDGTDATGFFNAEFYAPLKPVGEWPAGMTKEKLTAQLQDRLRQRFPGVDFEFSQYIEDNVEEAASGVKGANSLKVFGGDLAQLSSLANRIKAEMARVPGITDLGIGNSLGQPTLRIDIDRHAAARYGLTPDDINSTVSAAIGGQSPGDLYEKETDRHFPIVVRLGADQRGSIEQIRRLTIGAPPPSGSSSGGLVQVPLSEVADVHLTSGASFIYRDHQERYVPINFSVRGRDLGSAVDEARHRIAAHVPLPDGYHLEWAGELGNLTTALARLELVVPLSLGLIFLLLFANFGSLRDSLLAFSAIPMALVGGLVTLAATGTAFSISAAIGFVALFGIAVMDGILVVTTFNQQVDEGFAREEAILIAIRHCLRPVLLTCFAAAIGLFPAALSTGIGSQVQRPLALVVVGGMTFAPLPLLLVLPVLILRFSRHGGAHRHAFHRHHADGTPIESAS